jgi:hypothetical protein
MHPAPKPEANPQPVIHVTQTPQFINRPDGTIRAYYPGEDWYVVAPNRAAAIAKLHDEIDHRMEDPQYIAQHFALAQQHLNGEIIPGFEVNTISQENYGQRTTELGDQLRRPEN